MVTASIREVPVPQVFDGVTVILPDAEPAVTVILLVFCPAVIVQPDGTDQVYVTPDTLVTE